MRMLAFALSMSMFCGLTGCFSSGWHLDPRKPEHISLAVLAEDGLTTRAVLVYEGPAGMWSDRNVEISSLDVISCDQTTTRSVTLRTGTDSGNSRLVFLGLGALAVKAWEAASGLF